MKRKPSHTVLIFALPALAGLVVLAGLRWHWPWWAAGLFGVNVVTMLLYGYDKFVAGRGVQRVPENVLLGFGLVGGSPAALLSQQLFRHKTRKASFRRAFWFIAVIQVALLVWWSWR